MPIKSENTSMGGGFVIQKGDSSSPSSDLSFKIEEFLRENAQARQAAQMVHYLSRTSDATGRYVQLFPELAFMPVLAGSDGEILPLYSFMETLDEVLDYDALKEHHPFLSYAQINGALSFLRKIAQYNINNIDLDRAEDELLAEDSSFLDEIRVALKSETSRVLSFD